MIADMFSNKNLVPIVTELFIKRGKQNISLLFITQSSFTVWKYYAKFNTLFSYEKYKKRELQQIMFNYSRDIDFQYFMNVDKKCNEKPDTTFASDNCLSFR